MLRRRVVLVRAAALVGAVALAATALAVPALAGTARPHALPRSMTVRPSLGLPRLLVTFKGNHVPRRVTYRVYFDVTSSDKVLLCSGNTRAATSWACRGRIPTRYGALGVHTVEMDATGPRGRGSFEELSTFLVSDLGVFMAAPATTAEGDTLQLRVTAANGNAKTATNVRLHDRLPAGLRIKKVTAPCVQHAGLVSCGPFQMAAHTTRAFVITVIVTAHRNARLVDRVLISGKPDPITRNDSAIVTITVR